MNNCVSTHKQTIGSHGTYSSPSIYSAIKLIVEFYYIFLLNYIQREIFMLLYLGISNDNYLFQYSFPPIYLRYVYFSLNI